MVKKGKPKITLEYVNGPNDLDKPDFNLISSKPPYNLTYVIQRAISAHVTKPEESITADALSFFSEEEVEGLYQKYKKHISSMGKSYADDIGLLYKIKKVDIKVASMGNISEIRLVQYIISADYTISTIEKIRKAYGATTSDPDGITPL